MEADFADPIWCARCKENLDLDELPVTDTLKQHIEKWAEGYGKWIDWEQDKLELDAVKKEDVFNREGRLLYASLQQELPDFTVIFKPSRLCSLYK
ncbi:hypothetical protein SAMN05421663_109125 [Terribacillus halophilus]|uniref:Uncharacterized protein n=1 Tax=Terribacillus halophilus TaxID=361279 RepID=A0A1G6U0M4_9BACI|nr:hypothetical protein SAMN05421663_109125 [Terribacillus halophilus]